MHTPPNSPIYEAMVKRLVSDFVELKEERERLRCVGEERQEALIGLLVSGCRCQCCDSVRKVME